MARLEQVRGAAIVRLVPKRRKPCDPQQPRAERVERSKQAERARAALRGNYVHTPRQPPQEHHNRHEQRVQQQPLNNVLQVGWTGNR